ncbi:hypothetical protein [Metamycoplasma buccale]|uniref:hypothetical protein n=1 Tax=Metamycoplasma buccale TaxID=55602 RepID=UPI00398F0E4A
MNKNLKNSKKTWITFSVLSSLTLIIILCLSFITPYKNVLKEARIRNYYITIKTIYSVIFITILLILIFVKIENSILLSISITTLIFQFIPFIYKTLYLVIKEAVTAYSLIFLVASLTVFIFLMLLYMLLNSKLVKRIQKQKLETETIESSFLFKTREINSFDKQEK